MDYQTSDLALTLPSNTGNFNLKDFTDAYTDIQNYINGTRTKISSMVTDIGNRVLTSTYNTKMTSLDSSITSLNNKTQHLNSSGQIDWSYILNKSHNHSISDVSLHNISKTYSVSATGSSYSGPETEDYISLNGRFVYLTITRNSGNCQLSISNFTESIISSNGTSGRLSIFKYTFKYQAYYYGSTPLNGNFTVNFYYI